MKHMKKASTCRKAVALMTAVSAITVSAALSPPKLVLRPLTPGDIGTAYNLPAATETATGLGTLGVGSPVYLEVEVDKTIARSNIVSVTWALATANMPFASHASLTDSPLGANVPIWEQTDRIYYQVAGRSFLRPDVAGPYTILATVITATNGIPNATNNLSKTITAATYMGVNTCALCHSGGEVAPNHYTTWKTTKHASLFTHGINGDSGDYSSSSLPFHTIGYNPNTNAVNGGFDDVAQQVGWTFPTVLSPTNWAYMQSAYPALANLANVQCEDCHGPGSQHAYGLGNTSFISKSELSDNCSQCHDAPGRYTQGTEWHGSLHAISPREGSGQMVYGAANWMCVGCHTSGGFGDRMDNLGSTAAYATNTAYSSIGCALCHEPHGDTSPANNPHMVRSMDAVTMPGGVVITNAGSGTVCLNCHRARNDGCYVALTNYPLGKAVWFGGTSSMSQHHCEGDMIEGINAFTYGKTIPSAPHRTAVANLCVGCHMQDVAPDDPAYLQAGGHTMKMRYNVVSTNGTTVVTNLVDKVDVCIKCHGPMDSFNLVTQDYNGDGIVEGVQTEVKHLMDKLTTLMPSSTYRADGNYVADGVVKATVSTKTNWPAKFLMAAYNFNLVRVDGSLGVHNAPFAVGILKASIADLSGDANNDGLPDWWQMQYFGSVTNRLAAPNAAPAGDGVPNWLKYYSGLNPLTSGVPMSGGYVYGPSLVNPAGTNAVSIYTAAEVSFNTQVGTSYQIQSISALGQDWQDVGGSIAGTGGEIRYLSQTREPSQKFFRVVHTP